MRARGGSDALEKKEHEKRREGGKKEIRGER